MAGNGGAVRGDGELYDGFDYQIDTNQAGGSGPNAPGFPLAPSFNPAATGTLGQLTGPAATGRVPTASHRGMTGRIGTAAAAATEGARPMTSVKAAGYQSRAKAQSALGGGGPGGPAKALAERQDNGPAARAKEMERQVHRLVEASAAAVAREDFVMALERAKEAGKKNRSLTRFLESKKLEDLTNNDLAYCVWVSLAHCYGLNGMTSDAIHSYGLLLRSRPDMGPRLRLNMGTLHFQAGDFRAAIKQFRMALDAEQDQGSDLSKRLLRNLACTFVRMGDFQAAIIHFERVLDALPEHDADFQTAYNLVVCYYALNERDQMRRHFQRLVDMPMPVDSADTGEDDDDDDDDDDAAETARVVSTLNPEDDLKEELRLRRAQATKLVTDAAKLIAPVVVPGDWAAGFDWVVEKLQHEHPTIASELLIVQGLSYLKEKQFDRAIEQLKSFEKKDPHLKAKAATNLSFLYLLENEIDQALRYATMAVKHDRYNAKALVNMGNCLAERGELDRAKELYLEAIGVEADCVEAIFNLGLVNKQLEVWLEALQAFEKLHTLVPSSPEVIYHIADLHDALGNYQPAIKFFNLLITKVPTDPSVLARLGHLYHRAEEASQASHYYQESYRYFPTNLDVISYLGIHYVKSEMYEQAIHYFELAAEIQPKEVKWLLMVASCHRRANSYSAALALYERIHKEFPDNRECLSYLVTICRENGRKCDHYEERLAQLEQQEALRQQMTQQHMPMDLGQADMDGGMGGGGFSGGGGGSSGGYVGAVAEVAAAPAPPSPAAEMRSGGEAAAAAGGPQRFAAPDDGQRVTGAGGGNDGDNFDDADLDGLLND